MTFYVHILFAHLWTRD